MMNSVVAERLLKSFSDNAYASDRRQKFEKALQTMYGEEWSVIENLQNRMMFFCNICNKEMNCQNAVADHARSGNHQKTKNVVKEGKQKRSLAIQRVPFALKDKLVSSDVQPIGCHLVWEYMESSGRKPYYTCNLCGSHSYADSMYLHLIGTKHTDNYIVARLVVVNNVVRPQHRERCRSFILQQEGTGVNRMEKVMGTDFHPYRLVHDNRPVRSYWSSSSYHSLSRSVSRSSLASSTDLVYRGISGTLTNTTTKPTPTKTVTNGISGTLTNTTTKPTTPTKTVTNETESKAITKLMKQIKVTPTKVTKPATIHTHKAAHARLLDLIKNGGELLVNMKVQVMECEDPVLKERITNHVQRLSWALGVGQKRTLPLAVQAMMEEQKNNNMGNNNINNSLEE